VARGRLPGSLTQPQFAGPATPRETRPPAILQTFVTAARATSFSGPTLLAGGVVLAMVTASFMRAPLLPDTIIADRVAPETVSRRLGTFRCTGDFGLLAGPAVIGLLCQHGGRAAAMLATAAVLGGGALAAGLLIAEPRP
jgi:hypothetical protein